MKTNIVMLADSYKYGHYKQYPENMTYMFDYIAPRKGEVIFTGLQYYIKEYLLKPITEDMVNEAYKFAQLHGIDFNYDGWMYIVKEHNGYLPISIRAIPEGTKVKANIPVAIIESTDSKIPWVVGWVETLLMKVWYPTAVTTRSKKIFNILTKYGSEEWAQFALHNFGDRSMTSPESASIGGFAHLCVFKGSDNFHSLKFCKDYYNETIAGYSVSATEHSSTTSNAQITSEFDFVKRMLEENPNDPILSFVADSYDVFRFTDDVTNPNKEIRQILNGRNQKFVIRPDSGNHIEVIEKMIEIMEKNNIFDITINGKKASSKYGILWGDGINENVIENILKHFTEKGYAAENFVFGMGTQLGQSNLDRDTYSFAMKCSYIEVGGKSVEVFKDPITDKRKTSLKGKVKAALNTETNEIECIKDENEMDKKYKDIMYLVYKDGKIYKQYTLEDIRNRIHNG